jgi:cysteinyl-tRNA synthetase
VSPWGNGRPGWHIECSAMASSAIGSRIDIHSGGIDLKFPHHDNEIAQTEAYYDANEWVDLWLHAGHLDINGLKMSKSLKNFITIRQALAGDGCPKFTPRQLRIMFLLGTWDRKMDFQYSALNDVRSFEKTISEFFLSVNYFLRESGIGAISHKWDKAERDLHQNFVDTQNKIDSHLRRNFQLNKTFHSLLDLIHFTNSYLQGFFFFFFLFLFFFPLFFSSFFLLFFFDLFF